MGRIAERGLQTVNYSNFISQISGKLIEAELYDAKWFGAQRHRLSMMWNAGETVDSAYETTHAFACAQLGKSSVKELNPLAAPICIGIKYI